MEINKINALEKQPLVSVVIPVYNVEAYLRECLDSVCGQTYRNLEIILVDDESTDSSGSICDEYAARESRVFCIHQKNGGPSAARNRGMERATGNYIMFVDSDDWIDLDTVERALYISQTEKADVVMWSYYREYGERRLPAALAFDDLRVWRGNDCREVYLRLIGPTGKQLVNPASLDTLSSVAMKLYRTECVRKTDNAFVDLKEIGSSEDTLFNIRLFKYVNCVVYLPAFFYHYRRVNENSVTSKCNRNLWTQWKRLFELMQASLSDDDLEAKKALQNRISCGLIGLGLVLIHPSMRLRESLRAIRKTMSDPLYRDAVKQLNTKPMPPHWKLFFLFAKWNWTGGVYALLRAINYLKRRM